MRRDRQVRPQDRGLPHRIGKLPGDELAGADRVLGAGVRHGCEHPRRQPLDVGGGVRSDLDQPALHHRQRALIVLYRARADQREDVVVARLLHRFALVEDLRVVVLQHELAPVDPAETVAELDERVDRPVDAGGGHRDDTRLVGDDPDRDRRVRHAPVGGTVRRTVIAATGLERAHHGRAREGRRGRCRGAFAAGRRAALTRAARREANREREDEPKSSLQPTPLVTDDPRDALSVRTVRRSARVDDVHCLTRRTPTSGRRAVAWRSATCLASRDACMLRTGRYGWFSRGRVARGRGWRGRSRRRLRVRRGGFRRVGCGAARRVSAMPCGGRVRRGRCCRRLPAKVGSGP